MWIELGGRAVAAPGENLTAYIGGTIIVYLAVMFGVSLWVRRKVHSVEDFVVAGRRLPLVLAAPTLLATWFGAGTILTATDEVRARGMHAAALEPFGAGFCLILAGLFFAGPLWRMKLLTLGDFYRQRFGKRTEVVAALCMVPSYFGWIAAQFVAMAGMCQLFFGLPMAWGIVVTAAVGMGYTLIGGMWSVTLTDAVQMVLVIVGLAVLLVVCLSNLGDGALLPGASRLLSETPPERLDLIPTESAVAWVGWLGVFAIGALGNLPGQDLMQRVFSARSAKTACWSCHVAGIGYLSVGLVPLAIGLAANLLAPDQVGTATLPVMAKLFLNPVVAVIFIIAVLSAVLSTIDSAILSPATVLAENLLVYLPQQRFDRMQLNRLAVVFVTVVSVAFAFAGESAYSLLESAYAVGLVALFAPLVMGMWQADGGERAALASMGVGVAAWGLHLVVGWEGFLQPVLTPFAAPVELSCAALAFGAYVVVRRMDPTRARPADGMTLRTPSEISR